LSIYIHKLIVGGKEARELKAKPTRTRPFQVSTRQRFVIQKSERE